MAKSEPNEEMFNRALVGRESSPSVVPRGLLVDTPNQCVSHDSLSRFLVASPCEIPMNVTLDITNPKEASPIVTSCGS